MFPVQNKTWMTLALAVLAVMAFSPVTPASNERLVAQIDEPFEVGGQLYPAGKLSLIAVTAFSPVATLNEVRIDGRSLGLMLAQQSDGSASTRDEMTFKRTESGHLVLESFAIKGQPTRIF